MFEPKKDRLDFKPKREQKNALSFSSSSGSAAAAAAEKKKKRKIVGDGADDLGEAAAASLPAKKKTKSGKKGEKALLSFGDDEG